jgi:hypothetical protein
MRKELEPAAPAVQSPAPAPPEALDLGSIGAAAAGRAAGRMVRRPAFWIALAVLAILLYWILK